MCDKWQISRTILYSYRDLDSEVVTLTNLTCAYPVLPPQYAYVYMRYVVSNYINQLSVYLWGITVNIFMANSQKVREVLIYVEFQHWRKEAIITFKMGIILGFWDRKMKKKKGKLVGLQICLIICSKMVL